MFFILSLSGMGKTIIEKIWDAHVVYHEEGYPDIFYIDVHLIHEVTSPQAFTMLKEKGLPVRRPDKTVATADHNVPTKDQHLPIQDQLGRIQVATLEKNCHEFAIELYGMWHERQGIVHVIWPELWITQPGKTMVCGDSHTSTHGAFGALAFGIWTTEVGHVFATQCLLQTKPKTMRIRFEWAMQPWVLPKDLILFLIATYWFKFWTGYFVEYAGSAIRELSMEGRMTICNMSIEFGARGGLVAPDETTYTYLQGRPYAPKDAAWDEAVAAWKQLPSDPDCVFDKEIVVDVTTIEPMITYGTNPWMWVGISQHIPLSTDFADHTAQEDYKNALSYMWLTEGQAMIGQHLDYAFLWSCTNSRIEDLRIAAAVLAGKKIAPHMTMRVVPWSAQVAKQAKEEWLDAIFIAAWAEFRGAWCSACLGMNEDKIPAGKYCISTSNRNFEWRQWPWARTFLASPLTVAVSALAGVVTDPRG